MRPRSQVDFYLYASHEIPTWLPIVRALTTRGVDARFVLEPPGRNLTRGSSPDPRRNWHDDKVGNLVPLVDASTFARLTGVLSEAGEVALHRLRPRAAAVTSSGVGWLRCWSGARIRCMYGVGLVRDAYGHGSVNAGFDLVLAFGGFSVREIRSKCPGVRVEAVGYPKWAEHRKSPEARAAVRERLAIPSSGPVVLWLPTWADHSSVDRYASAAVDLAAECTVILKPHHNTVRFEGARLDALAQATAGRIRIVATDDSLVDLANAADVVVSDVRSGGLSEGLLAGRPVVGLRDEGATPDQLHPAAAAAIVTCDGPGDLVAAVHDALDVDRSRDRDDLVRDLFGPGDGEDAERAADAIVDAVARVGRPPSRRVTAPAWRLAYRATRRLGR